jgi:hypothetical protein
MPRGKARHHPIIGKRPFHWYKTRHTQLQERRKEIDRDMKKTMEAKGIIARTFYIWEWRYGDRYGTVRSYTYSDARREIKKILGISLKKALPRDVQIEKVEFNEPFA